MTVAVSRKNIVPETSVILRAHRPGLEITTVTRGDIREVHLTIVQLAGETIVGMARRLDRALQENVGTVVRHEVFGSLAARAELYQEKNRSWLKWDWPVTWVEGAPCAGGEIAGMHIFALSGAPVETLWLEGQPVGRMFRDEHARHCLLGEILPKDLTGSRELQLRQVFEQLDSALRSARLAFTDVARTWLFLDDILQWYGALNNVRREFFEQHRIFQNLLPASTGIGAPNPMGAAMVAGAWAVEPLDDQFSLGEAASPLQCPAPAYGSCFSRAVEMVSPELRRVLVSGTASIEPGGRSICGDDVDGQIDLTMQVVRAILVSRGMDFANVTRATAYLRHPNDGLLFDRWRTRLGIENWPLVITQAVVCRDELLFEIEVDALAPAAALANYEGIES